VQHGASLVQLRLHVEVVLVDQFAGMQKRVKAKAFHVRYLAQIALVLLIQSEYKNILHLVASDHAKSSANSYKRFSAARQRVMAPHAPSRSNPLAGSAGCRSAPRPPGGNALPRNPPMASPLLPARQDPAFR